MTPLINHWGDMPPDEFRRHAYAVSDWIAEYLSRLERMNVLPDTQPGAVRALLPSSPPQNGEPVERILQDFERLIVPNLTQWNNPNFFAYFANTPSAIAILAEFLAAALNNNAMVWKSGQAATELESVVLRWIAEAVGLQQHTWGMIVDTASIATMHALACARECAGINARTEGLAGRSSAAVPRLRVYASELVHSSIDKACITLGLGTENLVKIPVNQQFQMNTEALQAAVQHDRQQGFLPIAVVGVIGTTSAGSSDPIVDIVEVCTRERLWLHIDAAWAGAAAMLEEWRDRFVGWEYADSVVINPHKWLFVPMDLSILYTRRPNILKQTFSLTPEYLKTREDSYGENLMDYGLQLGRRFRSLKLWFVVRYFGIDGIRARLREHIALAQLFAHLVDEHPDFELVAPVEFALVCFRYKPQGCTASESELARLNAELEERINTTREIFLVHTMLHGIYTLRFTVGNLHTTEAHVRKAFSTIATLAAEQKINTRLTPATTKCAI
ncbi:MAG: pyridoxal-dependent decarboxylase [Bacteroidota bacterium]|nr:pyridoxal-dependent decarboxylase [Candidatus Kapabacteria bacterium]MDW8219315.1 pyridoxal-dependent decarboxylase [Bacteroidota bacterium]